MKDLQSLVSVMSHLKVMDSVRDINLAYTKASLFFDPLVVLIYNLRFSKYSDDLGC